jgi:hypothetical protein
MAPHPAARQVRVQGSGVIISGVIISRVIIAERLPDGNARR